MRIRWVGARAFRVAMRIRQGVQSRDGHQSVARKAPPIVALALALSAPAAAQAQPGNPLSPGLPSSPQIRTTTSPPAPTTPSSSTTNGGLGGGSAIAIAIGAVVVLGGISLFIWRDARRRAPVRQRAAPATAGGDGHPGERPNAKQRSKPRKLSAAERRRRKRGRAR